MARVKLTKEFKEAMSQMSHKEKDKLLNRLVAKDPLLVDRLHFELVELSQTTDERRDKIEAKIDRVLEKSFVYSPKYVLMELRPLSGDISRHVRATKDKYGEIYLNFYLLNKAYDLFEPVIVSASYYNTRTLNEYVAKRILKLYKLLQAIHEDYHIEFVDAMQTCGNHLEKVPSFDGVAKQFGLNIKYLLDGEVPEE